MTGEIREQLAAALNADGHVLDALLSTVRKLIADELLMAADALCAQVEQPDEDWGRGVMHAVEQLSDRADTLTTGTPS